MEDTKSEASIASRTSKAKPFLHAAGSDVAAAKLPAKYYQSKQIQFLHGLSILLDVVVFVVLLPLLLSGKFHLQTQVDGYFIVALISLFHLLLNVPLLIGILRQWDTGFSLFISTGIPRIIASVAVFIYMVVDEVRSCKQLTEQDRDHTNCFGPPILFFTLIVLQGILSHVFARRWKLVSSKQVNKATRNDTSTKLDMTRTTTGGGGTTVQQFGTMSPGLVVGESQRSIQTKGTSDISIAQPSKPVAAKPGSQVKATVSSASHKASSLSPSRSQKRPKNG